jgi:CheY-like chemotaxis protein
MRILIIEDDPNKLTAITKFLEQYQNVEYVTQTAYQSGLRAILSSTFDLLLLDMSMPVFDTASGHSGGRSLPLAGRDILYQMKRKRINLRTIIVTQYENFDGISLGELHQNLCNEFSDNYIGYVYYNVTQDRWRHELAELLEIQGLQGGEKNDTDTSC